MSHPNIIAITDADFESWVRVAEGPVLVKFEAQWCGPCKAMVPMIEEIAGEFAGKVTIATLDIDQNNQTPSRLGVRGVPTVMLFNKGQLIGQKAGMPCKAELAALIEKGLS